MRKHLWLGTLVMLWLVYTPSLRSQMEYSLIEQEEEQVLFNPGLYKSMEWRNIGPFRGGRANAVAGVPQQPQVYYMGSVGGGVWKTEDAGISWHNISDGYFQSASIGAIAVAEADPNIIFVGTGEHAVRGVMSSAGDGVYKSTDAGKTWTHLGLSKTKHISRILIHPENPDQVWVAAQGAAFGPSRDRGIFKSEDGGKTWTHVLYINNTTGAADLSIDPSNPRILYAGMWDHQRSPWLIRSGGRGSGIFKSTDGGSNWKKLNTGLPEEMGKVGVAVSPANPNLVYAIIEAENGGVYKSNDAGGTWQQVSNDRVTIGRAWYYSKIVPDPVFEHGLYVLNAPLLQSMDGGQSFTSIPNPHTDQHSLWINPDNPKNMILANDGGACITFNGGRSWSSQQNQATAQLYRIIADRRFPYHVYAGQQDNTSLAIPSRTVDGGIGREHWYPVAGGESAFLAFDPDDPRLVYGTSFLGNITLYDHQTGLNKDIMAYPDVGLGSAPQNQKYRFNWNAPVIWTPRDGGTLYHAGNVVFKSTDGGLNWEEISPDLTRNEVRKQGPGGGPFTNEGAGAEVYNTISYLAASPLDEQELWVGTDDGLVHRSPDAGTSWINVTPPAMGEALINSLEVSRHREGRIYLVATRYKFNDHRPMIYRSDDRGQTWIKITEGIPDHIFARVVREDPKDEDILYAGTESGIYISFNRGESWHPFQLNLPVCAVTDLFVRDNDLIAATAGRSIWILDDLSPIQQSKGRPTEDRFTLYQPRPTVRLEASPPEYATGAEGENPPDGMAIDYYLPERMASQQELELKIYNPQGKLIRRYSNQPDTTYEEYEGGPAAPILLPDEKGFNRFYWDLRRQPLPGVSQIFVLGDYRGGRVAPEAYTLVLSTARDSMEATAIVKPDPRLDVDWQHFQQQEEVLIQLENQIRDIHQSVNKMRTVKEQIKTLVNLLRKSREHQDLVDMGVRAIAKIQQWESLIIQTRQESYQDVINYPNQLSAEFFALKEKVDSHDPRVSGGALRRASDLGQQWESHKSEMENILEREITEFNRMFKEKNIPALIIPQIKAF